MGPVPTSESGKPRVCYRFAEFTLSPARRVLLRGDREAPLIPRYLDLLILLLDRRHEAVSRRDIFDRVWSDVVVSDGALSQAVRTLRRTLGDDSREPAFIRTVSRHGYRFVFADVVEAPDEPPARVLPREPGGDATGDDPFEPLLERLLRPAVDDDVEDAREAAETLHLLGTEEALRRLDRRPGHEKARALLRDARWAVPGAGPVPFLGQPGGLRALALLFASRLRRARRLAGTRWMAASGGGAAAGIAAGLFGGAVLVAAPASHTPASVVVVLALVGAAIGGMGAAGVGAGLAAAEAMVRSFRGLALVLLGALGGGAVGALAHLFGRWTLEGLFGHQLSAVGGGFEGVLIGGAAGLGYALGAPRPEGGGMATPRGAARLWAAMVTGLACAVAAVAITLMGGRLGGVSLDFIARQFQGSQVGLAPLSRMFGEEELGPITRVVLATYEGLLFGVGVILGLTRRVVGGEE